MPKEKEGEAKQQAREHEKKNLRSEKINCWNERKGDNKRRNSKNKQD